MVRTAAHTAAWPKPERSLTQRLELFYRTGTSDQIHGFLPHGIACDLIGFRHTNPAYPFLWEGAGQPESRWNRKGEGPVQFLADTPDGAWAEFLRHEEITDPDELPGIRRSLWAVDLGEPPATQARFRHAHRGPLHLLSSSEGAVNLVSAHHPQR